MDLPALHRDDGQATVEHVGLVALIAAVFVVAAALAGGAAPSFRNSLRGGFEHALCIVSGQACSAHVREPCPTLRTVKTTAQRLAVSYLRFGHDTVLAIERRSDGTFVMSLMEGTRGGVGLAHGQDPAVGSLSGELTTGAGQRTGRTYRAETPEHAMALVRRLRAQHLPGVRSVVAGAADLAGLAQVDSAVESYVLAGEGAMEALGTFGLGGIFEGAAKLQRRNEVGVRISAREREVTAYVQLDARAGAFFEAMSEIAVPVGARKARSSSTNPGARAPRRSVDGVDLRKPDAAGGEGGNANASPSRDRVTIQNPLARKYEGEAIQSGSVALRYGPGPKLLSIEVVGSLGMSGRQREIRVRLDPSDPDVRSAFDDWRAAPGHATAIAALGRAARDRAAVDVRTFRTTRTEHAHGAQGSAQGHALGVGFGSESVVGELIEQHSRPPGGEWEQRRDCLSPALA